MSTKASSLVAQAKQWASYYGDYSNGEEGAVLTAPLRIRAAWAANDADAFAEMFVENGSMLVGDKQLMSREEIREYMAEAFSDPYKGAQLREDPVEIRLLSPDVAVAITEGGILGADATELAEEDVVRAFWVIAKRDGDWRVVSHQTSPIKG